jgi:hypothetical protein
LADQRRFGREGEAVVVLERLHDCALGVGAGRTGVGAFEWIRLPLPADGRGSYTIKYLRCGMSLPSWARATVWRTGSSVPCRGGRLRPTLGVPTEGRYTYSAVPHTSHTATFLLEYVCTVLGTLSTFRAAVCPWCSGQPCGIGGTRSQRAWTWWQCQPGDGRLCPDSPRAASPDVRRRLRAESRQDASRIHSTRTYIPAASVRGR